MRTPAEGEEFQQFVVDQFGKLADALGAMRSDLEAARTEQQATGRDTEARLASIVAEMGTTRRNVEHLTSIIEPLAAAFDRDAEQVVEHDRRLVRLERHLGFPRP